MLTKLNVIFSVTVVPFWMTPTDLLLHVTKDRNLAAHVHPPPDSNMPPEYDRLTTCTYLHKNNLQPHYNIESSGPT